MNEMLAAAHPLDVEPVSVSLNTHYPILPSRRKVYESDFLKILTQIQETINRWKMLDEPVIEQRDAWVIMTIGNVWRLTRQEGQREILFFEYCIIKRQWRRVESNDFIQTVLNCYYQDWLKQPAWPNPECLGWKDPLLKMQLPFAPPKFNLEVRNSPYREQVWAAIYYAVYKLGLQDQLLRAEHDRLLKSPKYHHSYSRLSCLFEHYCKWPKKSRQDIYAIPKALRHHFLDRNLLSALCGKYPKRTIYLSAYISAIPHADALIRLARENRNFLPMLGIIPKSLWGRSDLLKNEVLRQSPTLAGLSDSSLRWLRQAPAGVLARLDSRKAFPQTVEVLSRLNQEMEVPVEFMKYIIHHCWILEHYEHPPEEFIRLFRLFAHHCLATIQEPKRRRATIRFIVHNRRKLKEVLDWFWAEGLARCLPDKNFTWAALVRHSDAWHNGIVLDTECEALPQASWESPLKASIVNKIIVRPLNSTEELVEEGQAMGHCVSSYVPNCLKGYRLFSLTEPDGTRSTLGLSPMGKGWRIDQHSGPRNEPLSAAAAQAAEQVLNLCNSIGD